jgi:signal transduction histidine kinase
VTLRTEDAARVLRVQDTGIGMRQQDLPRVFERFYRVDTARSRATGGTGLGLSIVRHAVERHGGNVQVESALGEGTIFTVTLPIDAHV